MKKSESEPNIQSLKKTLFLGFIESNWHTSLHKLNSIMVLFTYIMKWLQQQVQLTSILKRKIFSLW